MSNNRNFNERPCWHAEPRHCYGHIGLEIDATERSRGIVIRAFGPGSLVYFRRTMLLQRVRSLENSMNLVLAWLIRWVGYPLILVIAS